jgi:ATP-dependent RNA helicase DDX18/HAS1
LVDVSVPPESFKDARACFDVKIRELFKALRSRRTAKTLIFCNTVETCRNVENALKRKDKKSKINRVWAYHNALSAEVRLKNLHSFSHDSEGNNGGEGTERILVCTDRAARGIDFDASPVDHVILFDFPKDPAEYVRRVGRTARAGRDGATTVFAYGWQLPIARQIMYGSGKGKNKGGKLEKFTMMKSSDGWDEAEQERHREDEYYMKGGARRRKEIAANGGEFKKGTGGGGGKGSRGNVFKKKK